MSVRNNENTELLMHNVDVIVSKGTLTKILESLFHVLVWT